MNIPFHPRVNRPFSILTVLGLWMSCAWITGCQSAKVVVNDVRTPASNGEISAETLKQLHSDEHGTDPYGAFRFHASGKVVAIGDLHGDLAAAKQALVLAGAIDSVDHWVGGNLTVVQTGDQIDRWHDDRKILHFFSILQNEAMAQGGQVILLNGNHELMNVASDFRYVTPKSFKGFLDFPMSSRQPILKSRLPRGIWLSSPGVIQRTDAFRPGAPYARFLARRHLFAIVNDTVFVHGGLTSVDLAYGLAKMDEEVRRWLQEGIMPPDGRVKEMLTSKSENNPVWERIYSNGDLDVKVCRLLDPVLTALGVKRMVVGHTIQNGINSACNGKVWRIDVGLSRGYDALSSEVLEIEGDVCTVRVDREFNTVVGRTSPRERFERIESLLELDRYIPLLEPRLKSVSKWKFWKKEQNLEPVAGPTNQSISPIGVSQELWVEVMGNNPSLFTDKEYCPNTHRIVEVNIELERVEEVGICPELPVENVQAQNEEFKDSDEEFIERLNLAFSLVGRKERFRRATAEEYIWADTERDQTPKEKNGNLWKYATYLEISDKDPTQDPKLNKRLPSQQKQTHGVKAKMPNAIGFYRSGVWEWTGTIEAVSRLRPDRLKHVLVGGSWNQSQGEAASGRKRMRWSNLPDSDVGAGRLVMIQ